MSNDNEINVKFGAQITGVVDGSQAAANAVEQSVIRMKESITGLNEQVASIGKAFNIYINRKWYCRRTWQTECAA